MYRYLPEIKLQRGFAPFPARPLSMTSYREDHRTQLQQDTAEQKALQLRRLHLPPNARIRCTLPILFVPRQNEGDHIQLSVSSFQYIRPPFKVGFD